MRALPASVAEALAAHVAPVTSDSGPAEPSRGTWFTTDGRVTGLRRWLADEPPPAPPAPPAWFLPAASTRDVIARNPLAVRLFARALCDSTPVGDKSSR